jgi:hypothetical protein
MRGVSVGRNSLALLAAALCALLACSNDAESLYCRGSECEASAGDADAAMGSRDGSPESIDPRSAALRLFGSACEQCLEEECGAEADECAADPACADEVTCHVPCQDPPCHDQCVLDYRIGYEPSAELAQCAKRNCFRKCPIGEDYECTGDYAWPVERAVSTLALQLGQFTSEGGSATLVAGGIRARVCPARSDLACAGATPELTFESSTLGELDIKLPSRDGNTMGYSAFDGYVTFDDLASDPPRIYPTRLLFNRSFPYDAGAKRIDALFATPSSPFVPGTETGLVVGVLLDCRTSSFVRGAGLTVTFEPAAGELFFPSGLDGMTTGTEGAVFVLDAQPGMTQLTARHDGRLVTTMRIPVVAGEVTYLWLWPSTE